MNSEDKILKYYAEKLSKQFCITELLEYWTYLVKTCQGSFSEKACSLAINLKIGRELNEL